MTWAKAWPFDLKAEEKRKQTKNNFVKKPTMSPITYFQNALLDQSFASS